MAAFNEKDATYTTRPATGEMTIRHLLTHTSGLSYPFTSPTVLAIQTKTGKDPKELPLLFDPGTKWNYSPATAVLGDIAEKLSGLARSSSTRCPPPYRADPLHSRSEPARTSSAWVSRSP